MTMQQLLRFGGVGVLATVVHVLVALTASGAGVAPLAANFSGFGTALCFSYLGHARFTFGTVPRFGAEAGRFAVTALMGLCASSLTVWAVDMRLGLGMGAAMAAVALIVPAATYIGLRFWVFTGDAARGPTDGAGLAVAASVALAVTAFFWGRMINHDTAWYLLATRDWLAGAGLYTDLSEVNPPLNFYLTLPALGLADLFAISDTNGQYLALGLVIFASLAWSSAVLRDALALPVPRHILLVAGLGMAMVLPALNNIGQREQILVILAMPWAVGQLGAAGGRGAVARAALAAVGVCLKPHFLLLPLCITLWRVATTRSLRPVLSAENLTFVAIGAAYVGYVALIHPAYFTDIVPMAREVYGAYGAPMVLVVGVILLRGVILSSAALITSRSPEAMRLSAPFWALSAAGLGVYLAQGTGFGYHTIPFVAFGMVACFLAVITAVRLNVVAIALLVALALLSTEALRRGPYRNPDAIRIAEEARKIVDITSLIVLTTGVHAGPPAAIAAGADWASSYSSNWLVPGAINRLARTDCEAVPDVCARLRAIAARNRTDTLDDIEARAPELLVIDRRSGYFDRPGFDWISFMAGDPRWAGLFSAYDPWQNTERFWFYIRRRAVIHTGATASSSRGVPPQ
ncbi:MAG: GtrA family protein [Rhodobacteraceae bacterium]|nr:GtrA family protein [Paracoccaceae bacterium]